MIYFLLLSGVCFLSSGCGDRNSEGDPAAAIGEPAQRIVSLAPHLTELVYSAGAGEKLVGVVEYSDFPAAAGALPRVGDAFRLDFERIAGLEPDLVLAWESGNPVRAIERLEALGLPVVSIGSYRLADIPASLRVIGRMAGTTAIAESAAAKFEGEITQLINAYGDAPGIAVFYQISLAPLFTVNGGHLISELLEVCGGRNVFGDLVELAPAVSVEAVLTRNPEAIMAPRESGAAALDFWRRWPDLAAVRRDNLFTVDANLVTRATTRTLQGAKQICTVLDTARSR
ncbi:MAG: cobalamin-binding protein [Gammaproteobacteria bacterium]|nr:cobalamin-binding protein [Gammaproteobacteria bacterium]